MRVDENKLRELLTLIEEIEPNAKGKDFCLCNICDKVLYKKRKEGCPNKSQMTCVSFIISQLSLENRTCANCAYGCDTSQDTPCHNCIGVEDRPKFIPK